MNLSRLHPRHFWSEESGLTALLIFFVVYLLIFNTLGEFTFGRFLARLFFSLIIVAGVVTTFSQRWLHGFAIVLAVALLVLSWMEQIRPGVTLATLAAGLSLAYLGFLLAVVVVQVFREGPVTGHRIRGAIVVYLLLGGIFAQLYQLVALDHPPGLPPAGRPGGRRPGGAPEPLDLFQFHHPHHHRVWRHHPGPSRGPHLDHVRGPGGAALSGHHPGPVGGFGGYASKTKILNITGTQPDEVNAHESVP
jgi:hypothetical protein